MLARRLVIFLVILFVLQNSSEQVAHGSFAGWRFRKVLLESLKKSNAQNGLGEQSESTLIQRLVSVLRVYNNRLESLQDTKVKPFRPFFDGRFG